MSPLADNYCALAMCIISNTLPEKALRRFSLIESKPRYGTEEFRAQTAEMLEMRRQGMTVRAIGDVYGVTGSTVCIRLKNYR